jgi:hypothetical protein
MAGFTLPKLRWLLVGAAAAGFWAMTQEPPSRRGADVAHRPAKSVERQAALPATPRKAVAPRARPSQMATGSIPRPEKPVGKSPAKASSLFTISRVHLRAKASTSAAIVSTLKPGQKVGVLARDGKWRLVSVAGQKGWVHGDYLGAQSTAPKAAVAEGPRPALPVQSRPAGSRPWGSLLGGRHPARAPQGGNCQCPFDLMLNGKQCGEHSAYTRQGERGVECYL